MEHGGVYMDSDVVSLRAVPSDINNFVTEGAFFAILSFKPRKVKFFFR